MKKFPLLLIICISLIALSFDYSFKKKKKSKNFTVIELFTSQGSTACPPADEVLRELKEEFGEDIYLLAYHVDYWNHLGWEDPYGRPQYSKYQREYNFIRKDTAYTPQMIINGKEAFIGSDSLKAFTQVSQSVSEKKGNYGLECVWDDGALFIKYNPTFDFKNVRLNITYVKKEGITKIKDGKLGGKTLTYTNIVQRLIHQETNKEGLNIVDLPEAPDKDNFELIVYLQTISDYSIIGAARAEF